MTGITGPGAAATSGSMRIDVALVPAEARRWTAGVCIVVDELRASSTVVTLLDRGCAAVLPAASLAEARRLGRAHGALTAGEYNVVRPPGFDLGNSPTEIAREDLVGRTVALSTRNGTAVIRALPEDTEVLIGCLLNATACARTALARARADGGVIGIVCAGRLGGFALDDAVAAGCLVERLIACAGPEGAMLELSDGAKAARRIWHTSSDVVAALRDSTSGQMVVRYGPEEDVAFCARVDVSETVPVLMRTEPQRIERSMA